MKKQKIDQFEKDLDRLKHLIKESGDEQLEEAFKAFLKSFKTILQSYYDFLKRASSLLPEGWDIFEQE